jgi:NitT/TauT family transport system permease protein
VFSRLIDDIRVLTAISWTYITIAEMLNSKDGGIGALIWMAKRQSRIDKAFSILLIIVLIGLLQDKLFQMLDKALFPHKYVNKGSKH